MIDWTKVIITADDDTVAMAAGQVILLASGVPGESASVEVVETVTLDPLEDADVENVGDSRNVKLKFKIPRGDSGVWGGIGGNLSDQADLKQALDAKADIIHTNASGSLVHITDGAAYPVDSLSVSIDPVQDLHGYDAPWPAGGGKNLIEPKMATSTNADVTCTNNGDGSFKLNGLASAAATFRIDQSTYNGDDNLKTYKAGQYTVSGLSGGVRLVVMQNSTWTAIATFTDNGTQTVSADTANCFIYLLVPSGTQVNNVTVKPQLETGSSATSWTPYSNVCPISGHSSATVTRTGINIWDEEWEVGTISGSDGQNASDNTRIRSKNYISVMPNTQYYIHGTMDLFYYDSSKAYIGNSVGVSNTTFTASAKCRYIRFRCPTTYGTTYNNDISINYPATDTVYHAGHVQTVTIALGSTYYGGTLDALTGTLTVDRASFTWGTGESTRLSNSKVCVLDKSDVVTIDPSNQATLIGAICDKLPSGTWAQLTGGSTSMAGCVYGNALGFRIAGYTTLEEYETFLASNPLQFVYLLKTPVTITGLTPAQIQALQGLNDVWSDTGDTSIGYRADTKLYIDSKLAAAIAELQALILEH